MSAVQILVGGETIPSLAGHVGMRPIRLHGLTTSSRAIESEWLRIHKRRNGAVQPISMIRNRSFTHGV